MYQFMQLLNKFQRQFFFKLMEKRVFYAMRWRVMLVLVFSQMKRLWEEVSLDGIKPYVIFHNFSHIKHHRCQQQWHSSSIMIYLSRRYVCKLHCNHQIIHIVRIQEDIRVLVRPRPCSAVVCIAVYMLPMCCHVVAQKSIMGLMVDFCLLLLVVI